MTGQNCNCGSQDCSEHRPHDSNCDVYNNNVEAEKDIIRSDEMVDLIDESFRDRMYEELEREGELDRELYEDSDDHQPDTYTEYQDLFGGDDCDHGQYDEF